jgi:PTH1 family peptidyl-tRNA hydrolase
VEYIVVGLGNPGAKYENTRHNAGFVAIDTLAAAHNARIDRLRFKAMTGECMINGHRVLLMKPETFMNLSGEAVTQAMAFYKVAPEKTVILFDDISLEPGQVRIRRKGSAGTHNGMKNIIALSGSQLFPRVKIGVGDKPERWDLADWVLSRFTEDEQKAVEAAAKNTVDAVKLIVEDKTDEAMNRYNKVIK